MKCILSLSIFLNSIGQLPSGQPRHGLEYNITINFRNTGCELIHDRVQGWANMQSV